MCGIAGFWSQTQPISATTAERMARQLSHRGPDDAGIWIDRNAGLALAHRRLSIIDLSAAGYQPMHSQSGRFVFIFNGEIYNPSLPQALDREAHKTSWRGSSDTETLVGAFDACGIESTVKKVPGMFVFAVISNHRNLHCAAIVWEKSRSLEQSVERRHWRNRGVDGTGQPNSDNPSSPSNDDNGSAYYLPDDILVKLDRAAMAVGLETRVPFLDHRVVEFAWRLPLHYKLRNGIGKWPVREVLYRHVPKALVERPRKDLAYPLARGFGGL